MNEYIAVGGKKRGILRGTETWRYRLRRCFEAALSVEAGQINSWCN